MIRLENVVAETMGLDLMERVQSCTLPLIYLMIAVYGQSGKVFRLMELTNGPAGLATIYDLLLVQGRPKDILNYSKWRDSMFERAWQFIGRFFNILRSQLHWTLSSHTRVLNLRLGPSSAESEEDSPVPALVHEAYGRVVELGPGTGQQLGRLDPSKIKRVYGIEPNVALHPELRARIAKAGLENVYIIVPCGIEDRTELKKYGIESGSIDTVLSMKVLCSVPEPERMTRDLYGLLKPGGQLLLSEHVRSKNMLPRLVQGST